MDAAMFPDRIEAPDITVDVETFAARALSFVSDVAEARVLRIRVTRGDEILAEIVGRGRTLKPMFGAKVGGPIRIAEGDDLIGPSVDGET